MNLKNMLTTALIAMSLVTFSAAADYVMVVPQPPGNGTSVWAAIIAKGLEKHLGEKIVIRHIPGAKDIPGFNEFHNKLRTDNKTIMVSHGGNGVSYLVDKIDYDYKHYDSVGMMNLNIVLGRKESMNPAKDKIKIAGSSGLEPDGMAIAMLLCGNLPAVTDYTKCWKQRVIWVNGVSGGERRLGFQRGEFNTTRESPAAWFKFYRDLKENALWFHHGIYDLKTGRQTEDTNFPAGYQFEDVFRKLHGQEPRGDFYEAYALSRSFRDVLQKALWVNKGNPNTEKLRVALRKMLQDPETLAELEKDTGKYDWIIGADGNQVVDHLRKNITEKKLKTLVQWHDDAYQFKSVYKPELIIR
jgi:hypothetical protein